MSTSQAQYHNTETSVWWSTAWKVEWCIRHTLHSTSNHYFLNIQTESSTV